MDTTQGTEAIIKTDVLGRIKTPTARREQLIDEFERSGLSGCKFAELAGLKAVRPQGANVLYVTPRANATELRQSGMAAPYAGGDFDAIIGGGRRMFKNFGGNIVIDEGGVAVPGGLPLTEPLPPAPKQEEKKP